MPNITSILNQTNYFFVSYILMFILHEHMHYVLLYCKIQQQQHNNNNNNNNNKGVQLDKKRWYEHVPKSVETGQGGNITIL
jgi:hypothetical protein